MDIQQCFEILELDHSASLDELNQAYKDLAVVWHPDRFPNNPRLRAKAEEKFKIINEAYEKLLSFLTAIHGQEMMHHNYVERSESGSVKSFV
ncbi:hypothetical protein PITCH_A1500025 [uncultured Desulfobacterium sp.]|uniref:J domain-containing protein n=1 Tax=uncultured Desulfobacterium sp. TaxID=201089 RepID=A0A445MTL8_9BACT|nr:hypothetical protein PITCH_A1500025 [uncultured Desulfobacterium sp.]